MTVLGISAYFHDSAAALVKDGVVIAAAEEERFNRIKHYNGFPILACKFCLEQANITIHDIEKVVFYEKPFLKFERIIRTHINYAPKGLRTFLSAMPTWLKEKLNMRSTIQRELKKSFGFSPSIEFCNHHISHASLAYHTSRFTNCAILVIDAVGEDSTSSIIKATPAGFELKVSQKFPHSVGLLYSSFTYYLGFNVNSDEYKVMGLAPYGTRDIEYKMFQQIITSKLVTIFDDGSIKLNECFFEFMYSDRMVNDKKWEALFGFPRRKVNEPLRRCHENLALAIQDIAEDIIIKMANYARNLTGEDNLCIVGGCALNCSIMGKLNRLSAPNTQFVPFAPGDNGCAIGCALFASKDSINDNPITGAPYWGPSYSTEEITSALKIRNLNYEQIEDFQVLCSVMAQEIANQKIIGWFQGRMEFGSRALGNRSILADPRNPEMKDRINERTKFRESFRPFAPAVLEEFADDIFDNILESPYMSTTYQVKDNVNCYPAITHADCTSRVQTVNRYQNPKFYGLISAFYNLTNCPLLLNTSFNVMGEPIVCSPSDAIATFLKAGIDILVMEKIIIRKI